MYSKSDNTEIINGNKYRNHDWKLESNWKEISFPSRAKDWKKFQSNNKSIVFNLLLVKNIKEEMKQAYTSNYDFSQENKAILLVITDEQR